MSWGFFCRVRRRCRRYNRWHCHDLRRRDHRDYGAASQKRLGKKERVKRPIPATLEVLFDEPIGTINPNIYGHFVEHLGACIYEGIWRDKGACGDVVEAMKVL